MKNNFKILLFLTLSLLPIHNVYATCSEEEIKDFQKVQDEYKATYKYNKETKDYTLTIRDLYPDKYTFELLGDNIENIDVDYLEESNEYIFNKVPSGIYEINYWGITDTCFEVLKKETLKLSKYNNYSEDPLCEGIEDFVLCQPTYDKEIDYDTFVSRVNTYKKNLPKKEDSKDDNTKEDNQIIKYIKSHLLPIIAISIFIIVLIPSIILIAKSLKKRRRLE